MSPEARQETDVVPAPRIYDPGAEGWAPEPKVTQAEQLLYGEFAGVIRRLGEAAVAAQDAYSLTCKHAQDQWPEDVQAAAEFDDLINRTYESYTSALRVHRHVASAAAAVMRRIEIANTQTPLTETDLAEMFRYVDRSTQNTELVVAPDIEATAKQILAGPTGSPERFPQLRLRVDKGLPYGRWEVRDLDGEASVGGNVLAEH